MEMGIDHSSYAMALPIVYWPLYALRLQYTMVPISLLPLFTKVMACSGTSWPIV